MKFFITAIALLCCATQSQALETSVVAEQKTSTLSGQLTSIDNSLSQIRGEIGTVKGDVTTLEGRVDAVETSLSDLINKIKNPVCTGSAVASGSVCYYASGGSIRNFTNSVASKSGSRSVCIDHYGYTYAYKSGSNIIVRVGQGNTHNCGSSWYNILSVPASSLNSESTVTLKVSAGCAGSASLSGSASYVLNNKQKLSAACTSPGAQSPTASVSISINTPAYCPAGFIEDKSSTALRCYKYKEIKL